MISVHNCSFSAPIIVAIIIQRSVLYLSYAYMRIPTTSTEPSYVIPSIYIEE